MSAASGQSNAVLGSLKVHGTLTVLGLDATNESVEDLVVTTTTSLTGTTTINGSTTINGDLNLFLAQAAGFVTVSTTVPPFDPSWPYFTHTINIPRGRYVGDGTFVFLTNTSNDSTPDLRTTNPSFAQFPVSAVVTRGDANDPTKPGRIAVVIPAFSVGTPVGFQPGTFPPLFLVQYLMVNLGVYDAASSTAADFPMDHQ